MQNTTQNNPNLEAENNPSTTNQEVVKRANDKKVAQKKRKAHEDFRRKYFDYYDDVKTNIKQDW